MIAVQLCCIPSNLFLLMTLKYGKKPQCRCGAGPFESDEKFSEHVDNIHGEVTLNDIGVSSSHDDGY